MHARKTIVRDLGRHPNLFIQAVRRARHRVGGFYCRNRPTPRYWRFPEHSSPCSRLPRYGQSVGRPEFSHWNLDDEWVQVQKYDPPTAEFASTSDEEL